MTLVVGVELRKLEHLYDFECTSFPDLKRYDSVIVNISDKPEDLAFAVVQHPPREMVPGETYEKPLVPIVRIATPEDFLRREKLEARQSEAHRVCKERVAALGLLMKLIDTEWSYQGSEVTFHFVAEGRVDFRELVRDLAHRLHVHVMMHQVGSRDHARVLPAYGPCGRPTCCSTFLRDFEQITVRMAKEQHLALNPGKYSGLCGKLMCCLKYENDFYQNGRLRLPAVNSVVMTPYGRAKVMDVNVLQEILTVQLETQAYVEVKASAISTVDGCVDHTEGGCDGGCGAIAPLPARPAPPVQRRLPLV